MGEIYHYSSNSDDSGYGSWRGREYKQWVGGNTEGYYIRRDISDFPEREDNGRPDRAPLNMNTSIGLTYELIVIFVAFGIATLVLTFVMVLVKIRDSKRRVQQIKNLDVEAQPALPVTTPTNMTTISPIVASTSNMVHVARDPVPVSPSLYPVLEASNSRATPSAPLWVDVPPPYERKRDG
jgi:hypothetical protein